MYPQFLSQEISGYGSTFCCLNKEYATTKLWIERNIFGYLDELMIIFETNLSGFSVDTTRLEVDVWKYLKLTANKKRPKTVTEDHWKRNYTHQAPGLKAHSGADRWNFTVPIEDMLGDEHCFTISTKLIKCYFVLTIKLFTDNYCCKSYRFDKADLGFVILPFQKQAPVLAAPIEPEKLEAQSLPQSSTNPSVQDSNNPNPLIGNSFRSVNQLGLKIKIINSKDNIL